MLARPHLAGSATMSASSPTCAACRGETVPVVLPHLMKTSAA
jgi:hypothetical protein